jgi:taurine---2-oxoglutarate transaminase
VEPIVGTNGVLVPPPEYFPRLREICDRQHVLLIADEVMTGWGRTGKWFAMDHWNVAPDILVTAKGITSAYAPLGLCATTTKIASFFDDHFFAHGHTYEAHPLTLAPAIAAIHQIKRLDLIERSRELGEYLGQKLTELIQKHRSIGDVRGKGLFWAVELVKDRKTKEPLNTKEEKLAGKALVVDNVASEMMKPRRVCDPVAQSFRAGAAAHHLEIRNRYGCCSDGQRLGNCRSPTTVGRSMTARSYSFGITSRP